MQISRQPFRFLSPIKANEPGLLFLFPPYNLPPSLVGSCGFQLETWKEKQGKNESNPSPTSQVILERAFRADGVNSINS